MDEEFSQEGIEADGVFPQHYHIIRHPFFIDAPGFKDPAEVIHRIPLLLRTFLLIGQPDGENELEFYLGGLMEQLVNFTVKGEPGNCLWVKRATAFETVPLIKSPALQGVSD